MDLLGDLTRIIEPGDTIGVTTLENPSTLFVAPDTFTANVRVTFTTTLEESASALLPERYTRLEKKTTSLALKE